MHSATKRVLGALDQRSHHMDDVGHLPTPIRDVVGRVSAALRSGQPLHGLYGWLDEQRELLGVARLSSIRVTIHLHPRHRDLAAANDALVDMSRALRGTVVPGERMLGAEAWLRLSGGVAFISGRADAALANYRSACRIRASPSNICNVLAAYIRLGRLDDARMALDRAARDLPSGSWDHMRRRILSDPDLLPARCWLPVTSMTRQLAAP